MTVLTSKMFLTLMSMSRLFLATLSLMREEAPEELNVMNVLIEAERFAHRRDLLPTQILILGIDGVLAGGSVRLNASLLLLPRSEHLMDSRHFSTPIYHEALLSNMQVIVVSTTSIYGGSASKPAPDAFQNFRHRCLLHISLGKRSKFDRIAYVSSLHWYEDRTRRFACVQYFDHLVFWTERTPMNSCTRTSSECSVDSVVVKEVPVLLSLTRKLLVTISCNSTKITAGFTVTRETNPFESYMLKRYAVLQPEGLECFSYIRQRELDVSAFIRPFKLEVWASLSLTLLLLAGAISRFKLLKFWSGFCTAVMSLISVVELDVTVRRYSHVILLGSLLSLCFLVNQVYLNFVMSYFLDRRVPESCEKTYDCIGHTGCSSSNYVISILSKGYCVCSMRLGLQGIAGKPLRREIYDARKGRDSYSTYSMLLATERPFASGRNNFQGTLLLVCTRVSATIDGLYSSGLIMTVSFDRAPPKPNRRSELMKRTLDNKAGYLLRLKPQKFLEFTDSCDRFDLEAFRKIVPIVGASFAFALMAGCCELLLPNFQTVLKSINRSISGSDRKVARDMAVIKRRGLWCVGRPRESRHPASSAWGASRGTEFVARMV